MGAFATDQTLCDADLTLLATAQRGHTPSLRAVCDRFQTPLLALLLRNTGDWERAAGALEPLLERLCRELLSGKLVATDWATRAVEVAAEQAVVDRGAVQNGSGLEGLASIPRVIKRRALRAILPQLPLPELLALLLKYIENRGPKSMAGLVAHDAREAGMCLVTAHEAVQSELKRQCAAQEAKHEL